MNKYIPKNIKPLLRALRKTLWAVLYFRPVKFSKNVCPGCEVGQKSFRVITHNDTCCYNCNSNQRDRFSWAFFKKRTDIFKGENKLNMLHVAPERQLIKRFKKALGDGYITADLINPAAMVKMDITNIQYPDEYFDIIFCSHVLEHVPDDLKAIQEFERVLTLGGFAVILVPITANKTFEDFSITDPKERLRIFGQEDHVRVYGQDFLDRLTNSGFSVNVITANQILNQNELIKYDITPLSGDIFYCTKFS
jgi:SAM-dependent methyltransferase